MTYMYDIAISYGVVSLLLLGGFAYFTFKMKLQADLITNVEEWLISIWYFVFHAFNLID